MLQRMDNRERLPNTASNVYLMRPTHTFVPLVFEHFGQWGEVSKFLDILAKQSREEMGLQIELNFVVTGQKRLCD